MKKLSRGLTGKRRGPLVLPCEKGLGWGQGLSQVYMKKGLAGPKNNHTLLVTRASLGGGRPRKGLLYVLCFPGTIGFFLLGSGEECSQEKGLVERLRVRLG